MATVTEQIRFRNGLAGLRAGEEGPAVILLHPIGLAALTWRRVQPALAVQFRTLALDLLGFGASEKPPHADYSLEAHAQRVLEAVAELGWDRVAFVGNSLGGGVSLAAAAADSERVTSLTLIGTLAYPGGLPPLRILAEAPLAERPLQCTSRLAAHWAISYCFADRRRLEREPIRAYAGVLGSREGARAFRLTGRAIYGRSLEVLARRYRSIRRPALILHGDRDPIIPRWVPERLADELPDAELRWLRRVGHFPQEEDPDQLAGHILSFLRDRHRAA